jgi:citrate lyase beta subunit
MKIRTRAALFTPATHPERFPKASETGADLLFIDLEDSVAPADRLSARQNALAALAEPNTSSTSLQGRPIAGATMLNCGDAKIGMWFLSERS